MELRVKEEFAVPLSAIPYMRKKLRLLIESMNKDDPSLFVERLQDVVKSIDGNKSQHVWVSLSGFELQHLVDARARLYHISRGCSKEERTVEILKSESVFVKLDPVIARSFEGFLDEINDRVSELLFRTLNTLIVDFMMGVSFLDIDLNKLIPFINRMPLTMSSGLALKIACNFEICEKNKNDLVVSIYQSFNRRLEEDGCITLQRGQIQQYFSQFSNSFLSLSKYLFHKSERSELHRPVDSMALMQDVEERQRYFLLEYGWIRGEQLAVRHSKLEDEIVSGEEAEDYAEKLLVVEHDDTKIPETYSDPAQAEASLSDEAMCNRACELFRSGNTSEAKALYGRVLAGGAKPLIALSCRLALIEIEFKELNFDRDYLRFRQIIRKSHRIFNDYRSSCSIRNYQLDTKACELEQISDEAHKTTKRFCKKWRSPIEQQHFSIDELKANLVSLSQSLSGEDLDRLNWYLNEVEKLHEKMGDVLPLLVLSTCRLDQAFDDRQSWLSGIPINIRALEDGEREETQFLSLSASEHQERLRSNGEMLEGLACNQKRLHDELAALKKEELFSSSRQIKVPV